jgi:hypothetical protein
MKTLVETEGGRILGFTALGANAGEVMAAVQMAMAGNLPYTVLRDMVLTHPTIAEGRELFASPLAPPTTELLALALCFLACQNPDRAATVPAWNLCFDLRNAAEPSMSGDRSKPGR